MNEEPTPGAQTPEIPIEHTVPDLALPDAGDVRIEKIFGNLPQVTGVPTFQPRSFRESLAIDTTNNVFYFYDFVDNVWIAATVTDAHIRSLFSATSPISFDSSTGIISFLGSSRLLESFTVAETIAAGAPVAIGPYQSDGGIVFDAKSVSTGTGSGSSLTVSFTVGNNANRGLFLYVMSQSNSIAATWNGTAMTKPVASSGRGSIKVNSFYLAAPSIGTNNLIITGLNSATEEIGYAIYSYYNVNQATPMASLANAQTTGAPSTLSQTVTPAANGSILLTVFIEETSTGTYTLVNLSNNQSAQTTVQTNTQFITGDSYRLANKQPITVTDTRSTGSIDMSVVSMEIKAATDPSYFLFNASAALGTTYGFNLSWKANGFLGFSQAAYVLNASGSVATAGTDTHQSGLIPSSQYYLANTAGTISTTPGTVARKVGIAVSTTEILTTNIW